ncbi:hypothetical protein J0H58_06175 [bacterium]|nr:hypothetical protein [bacterium]
MTRFLPLAAALAALTLAPAAAQDGRPLTKFDAAADGDKFAKMFHTYNSKPSRTIALGPDGAKFGLGVQKAPGNTGGRAEVTIAGNFQVAMRYELETAPDQVTTGYGVSTGFAVDAGGQIGEASVNRGVFTQNGQAYRASRNIPQPDGKTHYAIVSSAAKARQGQLAVRRVGSEAIILVADGPDQPLTEVHRYAFTDRPVRAIRVYADTGGAEAELKARLYDLQVRTGADVPTGGEGKVAKSTTIVPLPNAAPPRSAAQAGAAGAAESADSAAPAAAPVRGVSFLLPAATFLAGLIVGVLVGRRWKVAPAAASDPD